MNTNSGIAISTSFDITAVGALHHQVEHLRAARSGLTLR